ncbi:MAG TPA: sigma-70 family RNA polymerase sigma factor [Candidatus Baltobacteraceae bacterium]|jgi:RNA polymerase sigma-70 factor (ECF subfamily)|nr:sigma-70 family RNA polymerase sigma factor [Candidatus Baltobacteraceae bacterium]
MEDRTRELLPAMVEARDQFMELVEKIRPELHRYCARMTGSVFDGEDVVQETLAKAYYALGQMVQPPKLRPWLFRIAHNTAMDFIKRYERQYVEPVADVPDRAEPEESGADPALVEAALTVFAELPPAQRSAAILKDVLGQSLEETALTMGTTVGAVKAALSRARANVARAPRARSAEPERPVAGETLTTLRRYADLFNAHDWDALRALLAAESRLEVVSRVQHPRAVDAGYYDRYAAYTKTEDLRAEAGLVGGVPVIAIFSPPASREPAYFVLLEVSAGRILLIRDFRYIPYIASDAHYSALDA